MVDCSTIPTVALAQESKKNMDTINQFIESNSVSLVDQYGTTRKTMKGYELEAQEKVDDVVYDATQTVLLSQQYATQAQGYRDTTYGYMQTTLGYKNETQGYVQTVIDARDATFDARDVTQGYRDETLTARDATQGYRDETLTARDVTQGYRDETKAIKDSLQSAARYIGPWSDASGPQTIGVSTYHNGVFWLLNVDLTDITASEPSATNGDWQSTYSDSEVKKIESTVNVITPGDYYFIGNYQATLPDPSTLPDGIKFTFGCGFNIEPIIKTTTDGFLTDNGEVDQLELDVRVTVKLVVNNGKYEVTIL